MQRTSSPSSKMNLIFLCLCGFLLQVRETTSQSGIEESFFLTPSMENLLKYGSAEPPSTDDGSVYAAYSPEQEAEADEAMRILTGLTEGVDGLYDDLMAAMNFPGCSELEINPDSEVYDFTIIGNKWQKSHLTYYVTRYSDKLMPAEVDNIIKDAFQIWADVSSLTFSEVFGGNADVKIHFQGREHGDRFPFDGRGGTLAHAYQPTSGKCHFDDDENWTLPDENGGFSLLQTMVHELGHVLGLGHSSEPMSIMGRFYRYGAQYRSPSLSEDDIDGIQSLYGPPMVSTTIPPPPPPPPRACTDKVDAVIYDSRMEQMIIFRDRFIWKLDSSKSELMGIDAAYQFLPSNINAAFFDDNSLRTFVFKNCNLYRYIEGTFLRRRLTSQTFSHLPCNIDAAFYSVTDHLTYIFKRKWVYGYSGTRFYGRIRISSLPWTNIPVEIKSGVDAVADVTDSNAVYFFKGAHYYVMDSRTTTFENVRYNINENFIPECSR